MRKFLGSIRRELFGGSEKLETKLPLTDFSRNTRTHIILMDGTFTGLKPGQETSIGMIFNLLRPTNSQRTVYYCSGLQWKNYKTFFELLLGNGLQNQIKDTYGALASRYRTGDKIYIFGYSRGAFAARSLCGMISDVGLIRHKHANSRNIELVWRLYRSQKKPVSELKKLFEKQILIDFLGVFDTVSALGTQLPFIGIYFRKKYGFHSHKISSKVKVARHALAIDEDRPAFFPELWKFDDLSHAMNVQQVWFKGTHADIGGQLDDFHFARPLANIPLVWMLTWAEENGLELKPNWQDRFPTDGAAPSVGNWQGFNKLLFIRKKRKILVSEYEWLHESVSQKSQYR